MTKQEAQERLNQAQDRIKREVSCLKYLQKAKHGGYVCPVCGSGTHGDGTGGVKYYKDSNTWACHACRTNHVKTGGDVIRLYQDTYGVNYTEALKQTGKEIGLDMDAILKDLSKAKDESDRAEGSTAPAGEIAIPAIKLNVATTLEKYYAECRDRLPMAADYLASRGISIETATRYGLGFDPKAITGQEQNTNKIPAPRLIIPVSPVYYVGRRTDGGEKFKKMGPKGASPEIFNTEAIKGDSKEIFVTEGALDALSVIEAGAEAIGLNSASNAEKLIELLAGPVKVKAAFILCLDNDEAGQKATETLRAGLARLNITYAVADICGSEKDPNEALVKDRTSFLSAIEKARILTAKKPDNTSLYIDLLMGRDIEKFKKDIPTGFPGLDLISGGLYPGIYALAAISSLGKTTFALQMGEQIAANGFDVLFFSLEQSRFELVSKGIARRTAMKDMKKAVTSLAIRKGYLPPHVLETAEQYKAEVGDRLSIIEGNFSCNIAYIGDYIRRYVANNGVRPVVFVDYLQILQPTEARQSTKETVDNAITELKRLSREINIPIVVISSVNRTNYLTPFDFESLKESGGIEYTCDVVWGLQLQCLNNKEIFEKDGKITVKRDAVKKAKAASPRKIELVCLKNRYGVPSYSCYFDYYSTYDYMTDCKELDFKKPHETPKAGRKV